MKIEAPGAGSFSGLGKWRYEGSMVLGRRIYRDGSNFLEEALTRNKLGMLTGIDVDGGSTLHEEIRRDWLGNVLAVKYPRPEMVGNKSQQEQACGDAFELDGFDRLIGAKLGIKASDWGKDYGQITQWGDRKLAYALDKVHNRDQVDTWDSGNTQTTDTYTQESGSNRYAGMNQASMTYDDNGNLVWDGVLGQMYVYDYLDRLCEVWRPYSTGAQLKAKGGFTQKEIRDLSAELHKGLDLAKVMDSGTGTVKTESGWELIAYYGYDPWNRKAYRSAKYEGTFVYTWDGWKRAEEYEETYDGKSYTYTPTRVFFDGAGIDEHLGYAYTSDGGGHWIRYTYLLGHQGTVRAVLDANGAVQERYLYDPYGKRRVYSAGWTPRSATQVHNDYGYTGRTHDQATGLLYYRNRWYHPALGRFLTYDPIGLWGDPGNWGSGYGYVASSTSNFNDPFGLFTVVVIDPFDPVGPDRGIFDPDMLEAGFRNAKDAIDQDPEGGIVIYKDKSGKEHIVANIKGSMSGGKWKFLQVVVYGPHGTRNCPGEGGAQPKGPSTPTTSKCMSYYKNVAKKIGEIVGQNPAEATRIVVLVCFANDCITHSLLDDLLGRERVKDDPNKEVVAPARDAKVEIDYGLVVDGLFTVLSELGFNERTGEVSTPFQFPYDVKIYKGKDLNEWPPPGTPWEEREKMQKERRERRLRAIDQYRREVFRKAGRVVPGRKSK